MKIAPMSIALSARFANDFGKKAVAPDGGGRTARTIRSS